MDASQYLEESASRRRQEIATWLREQVSAEDAIEKLKAFYKSQNDPNHQGFVYLQTWIVETFQAGDELWYYDTSGESWENLCGENGFAIVRNGQVVDFFMWLMN